MKRPSQAGGQEGRKAFRIFGVSLQKAVRRRPSQGVPVNPLNPSFSLVVTPTPVEPTPFARPRRLSNLATGGKLRFTPPCFLHATYRRA